MQIIKVKNQEEGAAVGGDALAKCISGQLKAGKKVLWLMPGGSNIPISVDVMQTISEMVNLELLKNLTVSQTDDRYGPVGHPDSNWQQLKDAGFNFAVVNALPVLTGEDLKATVSRFGSNIEKAMKAADFKVGQFGIGPDGHIAGLLPGSSALKEKKAAAGYEGKPFTRVTSSFGTLKKLDAAYAFVFGPSKKEAIDNLVNKDLELEKEPAQILKQIPECYLYSDS
jgi:6-phosphogluconolactonase/glucosamine-6-phosphate isomerase/deaminase